MGLPEEGKTAFLCRRDIFAYLFTALGTGQGLYACLNLSCGDGHSTAVPAMIILALGLTAYALVPMALLVADEVVKGVLVRLLKLWNSFLLVISAHAALSGLESL